jgi:drug/metabolite transporter (DMT)-like permease
VRRSYVPLLLALAALWGASYMFIKVAVRDLDPAPLMELRLVIAAGVLFAVLARRGGLGPAAHAVRRVGRGAFVLGAVNAAAPFTLIAWGEQHVDSGVAAIANSTVPIFVALLALRFRPSERVGGLRLAGVVLGLVGVAVLAGGDPHGGWWTVAGTLAVVLASLCYAAGGLYGQRLVEGTSGLVLATASMAAAALVLLPLALLRLPTDAPGWKAIGSTLALALLGTALGQLVWYRLLVLFGSSRASLVTYLLPPAALLYGVLLLGEPLRGAELGGLALVLTGVALGSGLARPAPRPAFEGGR